MKSRFRLLAALLALFAFSASFAEGLWASACAPMGAMDSMDGSAAAAHSGDARGASGHMDMDSSEEGVPTPGPSCPLTPVLGGCAAVFSPASYVAAAFVPTVSTSATAAPDPAPDLLLVVSLLRPPRA